MPTKHHETIISGRQGEIKEFLRCLDLLKHQTGQVKFILGDYGSGKTFILNAYKAITHQHDFLTASFGLSNGLRINKIEDLYYGIMHHLSLRHKNISFDNLFEIWVENIKHSPHPELAKSEIQTVCEHLAKFHGNFSNMFLKFIRARIQNDQEKSSATSAWLSGETNLPLEIKERYGLTGSVGKTESLDFLKAFIKLITLLDYKGLVVFIDEVDWILGERSDIRSAAYNNIRHLIDLTTRGELGPLFLVFSGATALLSDREKGLLSLEPLAQRLNLFSSHQTMMQPVIMLKPLSNQARIELTHKIVRLYHQQHPLPSSLNSDSLYSEVMMTLENEPFATRHFVTALIARLDEEIL